MDKQYGDSTYSTSPVHDDHAGYAGLELHRIQHGVSTRIARILFWDACGQFFIETFNADVPLQILEELIAEAKETIKVK